ncbi:MAG: hypothetical protein HKN48_02565 [Flavobacteriaceae bacterium]|nr:hypothetical protein [Flavobacteriaceae bacterium]
MRLRGREHIIVLAFLNVVLFFSSEILAAQEIDLNVETSVKVREKPSDSYLQFIPEGFSEDRLWPVVFVFDPVGNGKNGLEPFKESASLFGYIIVASNSARNGLHEENFGIAERLVNQVMQDLPIDPSRMYVAGFSGGSRLASAIAVLSKQFVGVIGCGSGFSPNTSEKPNFESFSYAGVVGNLDMNYSEMYKNQSWLDKFNVSNELFVFKGGHQWPPTELLKSVFSWLEKEAQRQGLNNNYLKQQRFIQQREIKEFNALVEQEHFLLAKKSQDRIIKNYMVDFPSGMIDAAMGEKELKKSIRKEREILEEELSEIIAINDSYFEHVKDKPKRQLKFWKKKIHKLKKLSASEDPLEVQHATRLLRHIQALAYEAGIGYGQSKIDKEKALFSVQLLLEIQPENQRYQTWYQQLKEE